MNYTEMMESEKAFTAFLIKQTRKTEFKIQYYFPLGRPSHGCSFLGYETSNFGLHGIHYDNSNRTFYFGTRNKKSPSTLKPIFGKNLNQIPPILKQAFFYVVTIKKGITITNPKRIEFLE